MVQKVIEGIKSSDESLWAVSALRPHATTLMKDENGSHVVEQCFQHLLPEHRQVKLIFSTHSVLAIAWKWPSLKLKATQNMRNEFSCQDKGLPTIAILGCNIFLDLYDVEFYNTHPKISGTSNLRVHKNLFMLILDILLFFSDPETITTLSS